MRPSLNNLVAPDAATKNLLQRHPCVQNVELGTNDALEFSIGAWRREVTKGISELWPSGLIELMDNNPMVCADRVGLPTPAATLALIALGPIVEAGIVLEPPAMLTNAPGTPEQIYEALQTVGWNFGVTLEAQSIDLGSVYAATVIAAIRTPDDLDEIDDIYEERFGRSFFVSRDEASEWDIALVQNKPHAVYRLRISSDLPQSLLTIQVMADRHGKCGAAQRVHAMNVMCGFEESLGIL